MSGGIRMSVRKPNRFQRYLQRLLGIERPSVVVNGDIYAPTTPNGYGLETTGPCELTINGCIFGNKTHDDALLEWLRSLTDKQGTDPADDTRYYPHITGNKAGGVA